VIPAIPRPAATACVVRDGIDGLEVLLVERSPNAPFVPGASVFPGGKVDPIDRLAPDPFKAAVIRETYEEVGLLLADQATAPVVAGLALHEQRNPGDFSFDSLTYLSTWVTPKWMGLRFDTRFYLVAAPDGSELVVDRHELVRADWMTPGGALERWTSGELFLIMPTAAHLRYLTHYETVGAAFDGARAGRYEAEIDQETQEGRRPEGPG
jgi:8-oxo-dGTP pyrophosphatase MutT (NUDIX family)